MKIFKVLFVMLLGAVLAGSCKEKESPVDNKVFEITADRQSVTDILAESPADEVVVITTDAPYWMITTSPSWVKANPTTAEGNGKSSIVTFSIESNSSTLERRGNVVFAGGNSTLTIEFAQLGKVVGPSNDHYDAGSGTESDPWTIKNAAQLAHMGEDMSDSEVKYFKLTDDIDLDGVEWEPINNQEPYSLTVNLDGNGKIIKNLGAALFYDLNGTVSNITISNATVKAGQNVGVLARMISVGATVRNVTVKDSNVSTDTGQGAGGLVGKILNSAVIDKVTVSNCTITSKTMYPAGIAGWVELSADATVNITRSCLDGGTVTALTYYPGGIVGCNASTAGTLNIKNCYVTGNVAADSGDGSNGRWAGGILGGHTGGGATNLENCYITGSVLAVRWGAGGIVGQIGKTGFSAVRCMAYNSLIKATNTGARYGSGAIVASCVKIDLVVDKCYRSSSVVFECASTANTTLFDMDFIPTPAQLPLMSEENPNAYYHHGKATTATLSALVQDKNLVGEAWSSDIWNFNGNLPVLK